MRLQRGESIGRWFVNKPSVRLDDVKNLIRLVAQKQCVPIERNVLCQDLCRQPARKVAYVQALVSVVDLLVGGVAASFFPDQQQELASHDASPIERVFSRTTEDWKTKW